MHSPGTNLHAIGATVPAEPLCGLWDPKRGVFLIDDRRFPPSPEQLQVRQRYTSLAHDPEPIVTVLPGLLDRIAGACVRAALASGWLW